jgi:hypothetical protein
MVIEKDVVAIRAKPGLAAQELPDLVERGLPGAADVPYANGPADGRKDAGLGRFHKDFHARPRGPRRHQDTSAAIDRPLGNHSTNRLTFRRAWAYIQPNG